MKCSWTVICGLAVMILGSTAPVLAVPFTFTEDFESVTAPSEDLPAGWVNVNGDYDVVASSVHGGSRASRSAAEAS